MPTTLNRAAWLKLLDEDLEWLREQPRTLERDHVIELIEWMKTRDKRHFAALPKYEEPLPPTAADVEA